MAKDWEYAFDHLNDFRMLGSIKGQAEDSWPSPS